MAYVDAEKLKKNVRVNLMPNVDVDGTVTVENAERYFLNLIDKTSTADVVEVETIKSWLYEMAINNVGCIIDGDFSNACEEIIARLDGLRNFAKERSEGDG